MHFHWTCRCGKRLVVTTEQLGMRVRCKHCQRVFRLPSVLDQSTSNATAEAEGEVVGKVAMAAGKAETPGGPVTVTSADRSSAPTSPSTSPPEAPRSHSQTGVASQAIEPVDRGVKFLKLPRGRVARIARQGQRSIPLAFSVIRREAAHAAMFYWSLGWQIAGRLAESIPTLGQLSRRQREIRLPARARAGGNCWQITLPQCCVVCGAAADLTSEVEAREVASLLPSMLPPLIATLLAFLVGYLWTLWAMPVLIAAGLAVGYYGRSEQHFSIHAWRCQEHGASRRFPRVRFLDAVAIVEVGQSEVKQRFTQQAATANLQEPSVQPIER